MRELYRSNKLFFVVLLTAAAGYLAWFFRETILFVIIAGVVSIIGTPLTQLLDRVRIGRFRFPHFLSVIITLLVILVIFFGLFALFIPLVVNEVQLIRGIDWKEFMNYYQQDLNQLQQMLTRYGIIKQGTTLEATLKVNIIKFFNFTFFSSFLGSVISFTGTFFFSLFSVIFLSFFFLMEPAMLPRVILRMTPARMTENIRNVMSKSRVLLSRYFIGLFIQIIANISTYSLALYIVGVPNALVIGFFSGVIIIIPYLGGIISMLMGVLIGATGVISLGDYNLMMPMIIKILIAMFVVQTIDNNLFAPLIQGKSVKAHPVEIFLVVIASATIGGILAMIVAVPAYGFLKIVFGEIRGTFGDRFNLPENS